MLLCFSTKLISPRWQRMFRVTKNLLTSLRISVSVPKTTQLLTRYHWFILFFTFSFSIVVDVVRKRGTYMVTEVVEALVNCQKDFEIRQSRLVSRIAKFLIQILRRTSLFSSTSFKTALKVDKLAKTDMMFFDVIAFYSSVSIDETIFVLEDWIFAQKISQETKDWYRSQEEPTSTFRFPLSFRFNKKFSFNDFSSS